MIPADLYQYLYLIVVTIFTISVCEQYNNVSFPTIELSNSKSVNILIVFLILFIGNRPVAPIFGDTMSYAEVFPLIKNTPFVFHWDSENVIFDNLLNYCSKLGMSISVFFTLIATIYFGLILFACRKLFPRHSYLAFLVYLGAFSTFSYGVNGIKAGAAAALFLMAIAYNENRFLCVLFLAMSLGFHHSMVLPIAIFIVAYFLKNPKFYMYMWFFCFLIAALHITYFQNIFAELSDEGGAKYLIVKNTERAVSGFRPDFIIYSAIPIILGYYIMKKYDFLMEKYIFIWNVYTGTNSVFLLCTYASYINRIAYLSWLLYPIVLIYPFLKVDFGKNQYIYLKYVVYGHLCFTLFMNVIYYA